MCRRGSIPFEKTEISLTKRLHKVKQLIERCVRCECKKRPNRESSVYRNRPVQVALNLVEYLHFEKRKDEELSEIGVQKMRVSKTQN